MKQQKNHRIRSRKAAELIQEIQMFLNENKLTTCNVMSDNDNEEGYINWYLEAKFEKPKEILIAEIKKAISHRIFYLETDEKIRALKATKEKALYESLKKKYEKKSEK